MITRKALANILDEIGNAATQIDHEYGLPDLVKHDELVDLLADFLKKEGCIVEPVYLAHTYKQREHLAVGDSMYLRCPYLREQLGIGEDGVVLWYGPSHKPDHTRVMTKGSTLPWLIQWADLAHIPQD